MSDLTAKTIAELRDGFRSGEFTARDLEVAGATDDAKEGLTAFGEKREPNFKGK